MRKAVLIFGIGLMAAAIFLYSSKDTTEEQPTTNVYEPTKTEVSTNFGITVGASATSAYAVVLTIRTDIPLPIEVMASVSIKDQKPTDTYIGMSKRVRLTASEQTVTLDGKSENLPSGEYLAEVTFYPRWGAENGPAKAMEIKREISGVTDISLTGSGESKSQTDQRNISQRWVMENVIIGTPWNESAFVDKLGQFSKSEGDLNFHDAYYFPQTDMTIIVNRLKNAVSIWRMGQATK